MIIKYVSEGEVEWAKAIGGSDYEYIQSVTSTIDGGYIAGGSFKSSSIDLENGERLTNNGSQDGMLIKYRNNGEIEWAKEVGGSNSDGIVSVSETNDRGYIVLGYFQGNIDLGNGVNLTNNGNQGSMIIKYKSNGEAEWAIGRNIYDISSVAETKDGGYIAGGTFYGSSIDLGNGVTLTNKGSTGFADGMIIKYSEEGEVEWAKGIGGRNNEYINLVEATSDGGYIVEGDFTSRNVDLENGVILTNSGSNDVMLIKYSEEGEVEWAKGIGGSSDDYIYSVAETRDGGYITGGYFESSVIQVGDYTLTNNGSNDGIVIKYDNEGEIEWAKGI